MVDHGAVFGVWRWLMLGATLLLVLQAAESWPWAVALTVPLVTGFSAVRIFPRKAFERWLGSGFLIVSDGLLISLALLATDVLPPSLFVALFTVVLTATLVADQARALLATAALLAVMASLAGTGAIGALELNREMVFYLPLLLAAGGHFGHLAQHLTGQHRAMQAVREETSELRALIEITETISSSLELVHVMRSIAHRVGELINTDSCSILIADPSHSSNGFVVASKGHPEVDMLEFDLEKYPEIRLALETREPVIIDDVESSPVVEPVRSVLLEKGYRSILVMPLLFKDEVLGTLFLRSRNDRPFNSREIRFCKVVAGASANALKNAKLYQEVKDEAQRNRVTGEKLRRVLDCTPDMILATDTDNQITELNRGAEELTGLPADRIERRTLSEVLGTELDLMEDGERERFSQDIVVRRSDGHRSEISLVSAPLCDSQGEEQGRVWIGRDVTKLRQAQTSLARAERLSSLGEVVAGVAHELNNPLSGVVGYAELLRVQADDPAQRRDLDRIVESAIRCQKIVLKLLSFARQHTPEKKHQSLNDCVSKVLDLKSYHLRSSRIVTELQLDENLPDTDFDFHQIEQVILNLLNNAEHALSSLRRPGRIVLSTGSADQRVFVRVADDGPGVPAAVRDRVFDPFFTTKDLGMGTGLGLSVSYGIIEEHAGRIELAPESPDAGACFTIWLPIVNERRPQPQAAVQTDRMREELESLRGSRILIAEDEPLVLELYSRVLEPSGAQVTLARDGEEAWHQLEEHDYDLIVTDMRMPNLDGQQLYQRVAAERPEMLRRFVFATGDLARDETRQFLEHLPNRILPKPLEVETVRRVLSQAIAGRSRSVVQ